MDFQSGCSLAVFTGAYFFCTGIYYVYYSIGDYPLTHFSGFLVSLLASASFLESGELTMFSSEGVLHGFSE